MLRQNFAESSEQTVEVVLSRLAGHVEPELVRRGRRLRADHDHGHGASRSTRERASGRRRSEQDDIGVRLLAFMIKHGIAVDAGNQVSFLPVDVAAHNLATLFNRRDLHDPQYWSAWEKIVTPDGPLKTALRART